MRRPAFRCAPCGLLLRGVFKRGGDIVVFEIGEVLQDDGAEGQSVAHGAFGPVSRYQSRICSPVQNSTSCFWRITSNTRRKYFARCGAPMM